MATTSHSSHDHRHDHHDWDSPKYVSDWASGQDQKEKARQEPFRVLAETIPYDKKLPIRILDVGAGYGALTQFLLGYFLNATAICQDGSEEMAKLGQERMQHLKGRFELCLLRFFQAGLDAENHRPLRSRCLIHRDPQRPKSRTLLSAFTRISFLW